MHRLAESEHPEHGGKGHGDHVQLPPQDAHRGHCGVEQIVVTDVLGAIGDDPGHARSRGLNRYGEVAQRFHCVGRDPVRCGQRHDVDAGWGAEQLLEPVTLELIPGRDILLVVENQVGERAAKAILYFNDRVYQTDGNGQLRVQGLKRRTTIPVKIFGSGFGVWEGSFATDRERVVITVPG